MDRHGRHTTCAVRVALPLLAPLSRQRRNSNAVHLWRFFYSQASWLLTCGGSESLGESRPEATGKPEPSTQEVLAGLVERITYHNAENGFCVLRAKARGHRDVVTVVGHAATISAGEWITASGEWVNDRTHGLVGRFEATRNDSEIFSLDQTIEASLNRSESRWGAVETLPVLPAHTMPKLDIAGPLSRASAAIASKLGPAPEQLPEPVVMIGCAPAAVGDAKMENAVKSFEPSIDHFIRIIGSGIEIFGVLVIVIGIVWSTYRQLRQPISEQDATSTRSASVDHSCSASRCSWRPISLKRSRMNCQS